MKCAGALAALAICSACSNSAVAPPATALHGEYVGRMLWVNGRPVTAARMNLSPPLRYATIVPDRRRSRERFEYVMGSYGSYASIFD